MKPLADRDRERPAPDPPPVQRSARGPAAPRAFVVERSGEAIAARAVDVSRARLSDLQRGRPAPQREIDLHGLDVGAARRALTQALTDAREAGERCVLVIHGRGRRSAGGPVLPRAVAEWLQAPPHADRVQAFATAPRHLGGAGASLVLLRRRR